MTPTPILDRVTPLPAPVPPGRGSRIIAGVGVAVGFAIALTLGLAKPAWGRSAAATLRTSLPDLFHAPWTPARAVVTTASLLFALVGFVVLHEFGHLIGGLLAGFRFNTIAIGPIKLDDRFRISIHRGPLAWSGGWVSMFPVARDRLRWRAIVLVAAGPLVCMLVGAGALLARAVVGPASALFVAGCLLGVLDLLPVRAGAVTLDGWRLVRLFRDDAWGRRWLALLSVPAEFRNGVAPDELPRTVLDALVACEDESAETSIAHAIVYAASFHAGDDERTARMLETSLRFSGHAPPPFRQALMSDAAVFQARRRRRPDLALAWRNDIAPDAPSWLRTRAEAAILQAQGQTAAALARLDDCEQAIAALPMPTEAQRQMAIRQLGRWKAELSVIS